jgi:N-acyl amino acid synthase of PEP-CTERM/exosortase system
MLNTLAAHRASVFVALADTLASRRLHHRLRYQVYCQKLGYEDPTRFPDGEERDQYDEHAVQFLAYDVRREDWIGTLRLVPPEPVGLPLTSLTGLAANVVQLVKRQRVAEISRMCVLPSAPRGDRPPVKNNYGSAMIFFALVRASVAYAFGHGFDHLAFLSTVSLSRLLGRVGIADRPAGAGCDHRGQRFPRIADAAHLYRSLIEAADQHPFASRLGPEPFIRFSALSGGIEIAASMAASD